jgi:hypothetical protein
MRVNAFLRSAASWSRESEADISSGEHVCDSRPGHDDIAGGDAVGVGRSVNPWAQGPSAELEAGNGDARVFGIGAEQRCEALVYPTSGWKPEDGRATGPRLWTSVRGGRIALGDPVELL